MFALSSKLFKGYVIKYRDGILDPIVLPFLRQRNVDHVFQHDNARCHVARVYQDFHGRYYHRICHQLNIYGMNSIDVFATVSIQRKHYRSCVTHLRKSGTIFHKPLSTDWLVLCIGDAKLSLLQEVVTHVTELHKPPYCMTISVCPWFVLIMMLRNFVDIALFVMPIWIYIIRFFFSMQKIFSIKPLYRFFCWLV